MTSAEILAFNAGVRTALDHVRRIAQAIEARSKRPLAEGFAVEALNAFAVKEWPCCCPCSSPTLIIVDLPTGPFTADKTPTPHGPRLCRLAALNPQRRTCRQSAPQQSACV